MSKSTTMIKPTTSIKIALDRIAGLVDAFVIEEGPERGRVLLSTKLDPWDLGQASMRYPKALAMLADHAKHLDGGEGIRDVVMWTGRIPTGLAAHEDEALNWLQL